MFGYLVLIVGVLLLLQNLGWISGTFWGIVWPIIIIAIGLGIISKSKCCGWGRWGHWRRYGEEMHKKFHEHENQDE